VITHAEIDKLRCIRAPENSVLSLYLEVPLDPAALRELPARASDLIRTAADGSASQLNAEDEQVAKDLLMAHRREWLGHTAAIFVCGDLGLQETILLPAAVAERAVLAVRPHVRPLLVALQRHPDHQIAIIDRRDAWLLSVGGDQVRAVGKVSGDSLASTSSGGWYGLESDHVQRHLSELARHHYQDAAAILIRAARSLGPQPLVIGGHADGIRHLLAELPHEVRDGYAGCFAADLHTLTPARARELAAPVLADWTELRERRLVQELTGAAAGARAAIGLQACLAAVNADAADLLLIPDGGTVPGYHCERCDALSVTGDECCDWGAAARAVPDLLEEMALRTLQEGGDVTSVRELPCGAAARLH
jgi:hypothetical protein